MKISWRLASSSCWISFLTVTALAGTLMHAEEAPPAVGSFLHVAIMVPEFGDLEAESVLAADPFFVVVRDKFPVSPGHTLVIARRPVARFQELTAEEKIQLIKWVDWTQKTLLATLTPKPDGFNFGINDGVAAGQTKPQFHFHVIPRYVSDVADPRGGVRSVIPAKTNYWDKTQRKTS